MSAPDLINGSFEMIGGVPLWLNVRQLSRDQKIKGVRIFPTAFFALWGFWNLYYYPHLGQWLSFVGGVNIVIANTVWVLQMFWYSGLRCWLLHPKVKTAFGMSCVARGFIDTIPISCMDEPEEIMGKVKMG